MQPSRTNAPKRDRVAERVREAGLKATPQRVLIYEALLNSTQHPSPESIFASVKPKMPSISLATVYKTLAALEAAGLIAEVARFGEKRRYDAKISSHHHLVCRVCGRIEDVEDGELDSIALPGHVGAFELAKVQVQFLGVCIGCRDEMHDGEE